MRKNIHLTEGEAEAVAKIIEKDIQATVKKGEEWHDNARWLYRLLNKIIDPFPRLEFEYNDGFDGRFLKRRTIHDMD